jgi:catechol 2,3-dioxygenase-like lactoylglutathione lyase family enzyme
MEMINGAHVVIYSKDAEADRRFFRDVLRLDCVDAGEDWLIFRLPPAEAAFHPGEENGRHELYLQCPDIHQFMDKMKTAGVSCTPVQILSWGFLTEIILPGGSQLGVYQPRHPLAHQGGKVT